MQHLHAAVQGLPPAGGDSGLPRLESILHPGFPADYDTLHLVAGLVREIAPRHVIALGSGVASELLALLGFEHGRMVVSTYEHDPWAAEELLNVASPYAINYRWFAFRLCPLVARRCGDALQPVYDDRMTVPLAPYPADLVLIEGPPPELGGRGGMIYQALAQARPGAVIVLLDARPDEREMLEHWQRDLNAHLRPLPPWLLDRHPAFVVLQPMSERFALELPRAQEQDLEPAHTAPGPG